MNKTLRNTTIKRSEMESISKREVIKTWEISKTKNFLQQIIDRKKKEKRLDSKTDIQKITDNKTF